MKMTDPQGYQPTTTHATWGAGDPHLRITRGDDRFVFHITTNIVHIGAATGNELLLTETDPIHATIVHDDGDEYVLTLHGEGEMSSDHHDAETESGERSEVLRTGSCFTAGPWLLVFGRDEFADHGRPFGGREGGEGTSQRPQAVRPDYGHHENSP
ncbi:hypothetical protein [Microbacterium sp. A84]|uniref:hypothetical protein n=1 Tax=Microbacterium sp. A84 TaxID=3450715 RepID=UPI003F4257A3